MMPTPTVMNTTTRTNEPMKIYILGIALGLLVSISSVAEQKAYPPQEISYCNLVKSPQQFAKKRIRVRAIYKYGFEIQRLDSPACCPEHGIKVWVEIKSGLEGDSRKLYRKFPRGMGLALATFEGTFESGGPYGDGGYRFKFTVDKIEKLEGTAKASPNGEPAWIPKDCETSAERDFQENPIPFADTARNDAMLDSSMYSRSSRPNRFALCQLASVN